MIDCALNIVFISQIYCFYGTEIRLEPQAQSSLQFDAGLKICCTIIWFALYFLIPSTRFQFNRLLLSIYCVQDTVQNAEDV